MQREEEGDTQLRSERDERNKLILFVRKVVFNAPRKVQEPDVEITESDRIDCTSIICS